MLYFTGTRTGQRGLAVGNTSVEFARAGCGIARETGVKPGKALRHVGYKHEIDDAR